MRPARTCLAVVVTLLLVGCAAGPSNVSRENDRLRQDNLELTRKVETLEREIEARVNQVSSLQKQIGREPKTVDGELLQVTSIRFGRYSGALDKDKDGRDELLRIYLHTLDQRGRFMPVSGTAHLLAAHLQEGQPPKVVAEKTLSAQQLDAAYRSGITGTHYTLEAPLTGRLDYVAVRVTFTDAATAAVLTHEQSFPVQ